ncbi:hypothetical protein UY3_00849 [Chelonia mydas]|uniref:Uncharacterized protein n=1 Tax=Chelonia mydas TaxID=8469 RepID=M7CL67_CHEMY|nr:hypothetical protein UY3_00849 [Chelonia mydas]
MVQEEESFQILQRTHLVSPTLRRKLCGQSISEVLGIDRYMKGLLPDICARVSQNEPSTYDEVVALVERRRTPTS